MGFPILWVWLACGQGTDVQATEYMIENMEEKGCSETAPCQIAEVNGILSVYLCHKSERADFVLVEDGVNGSPDTWEVAGYLILDNGKGQTILARAASEPPRMADPDMVALAEEVKRLGCRRYNPFEDSADTARRFPPVLSCEPSTCEVYGKGSVVKVRKKTNLPDGL